MSKPSQVVERRFEIPVSPDLLRQLQGTLCIRCGLQGGQLFPDGRAFTISPGGGDPIPWDVRAHAKCPGGDR
ncbi:hypothetical protein [Streptomyces sp. NPDC055607]